MKSSILTRTIFFSVRIGLGEFRENLNKTIIIIITKQTFAFVLLLNL